MKKKTKFVSETGQEGRKEEEMPALTRTTNSETTTLLDPNSIEEDSRHRKTPQPIEEDVAPPEQSIRKYSTPNSNSQHNQFNMLNSDSPFASATRSIYMGNLPLPCTIRDICDLVRGERGIESVRLLPAKSCAFVDFISRQGAERFISRIKKSRNRPQISGQEIKLGWAKEKLFQPTVLKAIENGATRNVYLSLPANNDKDPDALLIKFNDYLKDLEAGYTEYSDYFTPNSNTEITDMDYPLISFLYGIFDEFGPLDMIKVVPARRIAFIHMAQVSDAMRAVAELSARNEFKGKRLAFGRDRCGERTLESGALTESFDNNMDAAAQDPHSTTSHRTVYLGGCNSPEITIEDICDHIHTGQLQSVRVNRERRCAFVTFINPVAAEMFLARALQFGLNIRNCQLKPAFAKESTGSGSNALPLAISTALRKGYTRNLYLGNVDFSVLSESRLRTEMSRFGPLDRIQILKDRGVAFVHFANLLDGGRAFEFVKSDICYKNCRVGFGRDRCEPHNSANNSNTNAPITNNQMYNFMSSQGYNPYYYHPMMYDPTNPVISNVIYHQQQQPQQRQQHHHHQLPGSPLDYPPVPYHVQSTDEYLVTNSTYSINISDDTETEPAAKEEEKEK